MTKIHIEFQRVQTWLFAVPRLACAGRLATYYLKSAPLQKLGQAVSKVRELRKYVARNEPTPALLDDARCRIAEASLWSDGDTFLKQPLAQDVFRDLGGATTRKLCSEPIAEIRIHSLTLGENLK